MELCLHFSLIIVSISSTSSLISTLVEQRDGGILPGGMLIFITVSWKVAVNRYHRKHIPHSRENKTQPRLLEVLFNYPQATISIAIMVGFVSIFYKDIQFATLQGVQ